MNLVDASMSIPGYDNYGVREFSGAGLMQCLSGLAFFLAVLVLSALLFIVQIQGYGHYIALLVLFVEGACSLGLMVLSIPVKHRVPWELDRWMKRHVITHFIVALFAIAFV